MQLPNLRMPSGYESEQRKIEAKRRIAQAMLAQGIAPDRVSSWTQVLAKLAQTWVGKSEDKKATRMEGEMYDRMQGDLSGNLEELERMKNAGATNQDIVARFRGNPMMADYIKMHEDAIASGLKNQEDLVDSGGPLGYVRKGDYVGKPMPADPNKPVWINPETNQIEVNPVRATAAQAAQGLVSPRPGDEAGMITPVYSMPWPGAQGSAPAQSDYSPAPQPRIPPGAMQMLIQDPSLAQEFDEKYGPGSAEEVIRSTGRPYQIEEGPF
jgi:hypothetical protein